jgi:putative peptidoglycan lipid II flippase
MERRPIARAAVIIMLGNLVTSALGFARQSVTARYFNGVQTDAWFAAYTVPQMFYDLIIGGAIAAALIPSFTRLAESSKEDFWRVVTTIFVMASLALIVMIGILEIAAHPFMAIIASGFNLKSGHGRLDLSVKLVRIILPTLFFWGLSAVSLAALYSIGKRVVASFATACFHLGIIIAAVALSSPLGVVSLPIGAAAGAASQFLVQVPSLWRSRREVVVWAGRYVSFRDPAVRKILILYAPVAAGIVVSIAGQIADLEFKTRLGQAGKFAAMQYATTLIQFPVGIVVAALGLAVLPFISRDAAEGKIGDLKEKLALGFRVVLVIMIPAAVGFATLGHEIVALLYQHGRFTSVNTGWSATALLGYAPQLPFIGIDQLLIFAFYARQNTVIPMLVGVFGVCVYVISALILLGPLNILGLALANTLQISLHATVLAILLTRAIGAVTSRGLIATLLKVGVASGAMGGTVLLIAQLIGSENFGHFAHLWAVALPMLAAVAVYGGLIYLFKVEEITLFRAFLVARFRGTNGPAL